MMTVSRCGRLHLNSASYPALLPVLQVERNISEMKSRKAEQKAKLDRLRGTTDTAKKE